MQDLAEGLYKAVTRQARQFIFFEDLQVPDTPQGRFELLALHLALVLRRLKLLKGEESEKFTGLTQSLCDWVVADIEESLRAMRISELKIDVHLKKFMEGFYGRLVAYDKALELKDKDMLEEAIRRNVYGIVRQIEDRLVKQMADYTCQVWEKLQKMGISQIAESLNQALNQENKGHGVRSSN